MRKVLLILFSVFIIGSIAAIYLFCGPSSGQGETEIFVVPQAAENFDTAGELAKQGFVRNESVTKLFLGGKPVAPGGYRLTKSMWLWETVSVMTHKPSLLWITISGCLRREQIGELIGNKLGWDATKLEGWNNAYKSMEEDYIEGVYYPDTYLIPTDETGQEVAKRFIDRFNGEFAPYFQKFQDANIRWVTALKIASLIEREAGGPADMKLISGIIWNRLDKNMLLQIDATMQYTRGNPSTSSGQIGSWWGSIDLAEKSNESPYNTYLHKGLPPTPICSPSITSIEAVLEPEETDCLYYLHDKEKQIHCAETYAGHKANIKLYLQ